MAQAINTNPDNTGKVLSVRTGALNRATLGLSYSATDAATLRDLAASFTVKGRKLPLSVVARRALFLYVELVTNPADHEGEQRAFSQLVTPS